MTDISGATPVRHNERDLILQRVSVASDGTQSADNALRFDQSGDGRYVIFDSPATNLVAGDSNGVSDVFVRDLVSGTTERISLAHDGSELESQSRDPSISADGRFVAFSSFATDVLDGVTTGQSELFLLDRETGILDRITRTVDGQAADGPSFRPSISGDGRFVAFTSRATNLVDDATGAITAAFLFDRATGTTIVLPMPEVEAGADLYSYDPVVSEDGGIIAYLTDAETSAGSSDFVTSLLLYDSATGTTEVASPVVDGASPNDLIYGMALSSDGRFVTFSSEATNHVDGDANGQSDVFVYDRETGLLERVSVGVGGIEADGDSLNSDLSGEGRFVVFGSDATNLVDGDTNGQRDIFVLDRSSGGIERVSLAVDGAESNGLSYRPSISGDGRFVFFQSVATNLVPNDTNAVADVFMVANPLYDGGFVIGATPEADSLTGTLGPDTIDGLDGDDLISGGAGDDSLSGGAGKDTIAASAGDDSVAGDAGDDSIGGGTGNDTIDGGDGNDTIGGGRDDDTLSGGAGDDAVFGGQGNDTLLGNDGNDTMGGGFGTDSLLGGLGDDSLGGGTGADTLVGGAGNDSIGGGEGDDSISGGIGDDFLAGGGRNDTVDGGEGADVLNGGAGNDVLTGGAGADVFVFNALVAGEQDVITDFEDGIDLIRMRGVSGQGSAGKFDALDITQDGADAVIAYEGHAIRLDGVSVSELTRADFAFL